MLNIAIFASGRGTNFEALHRVLTTQRIDAAIAVVISNNSDAGALSLARSFHIPAVHLSRKQCATDTEFADRLLETLASYNVDLIVLAGYMKKLDAALVARYRNRILNIHPALLPKFGGHGMYGHYVHEAVIAAGEKESGATVHLVTDEYDEGPIVLQERVPVAPGDTPESLAAKVLVVEHALLPRAVAMFARHEIDIEHNRVIITRQPSSETDTHVIRIRKALISVSDKTGIVAFASALHALGVEIISTGGTHSLLREHGVPAKQISELTGFPEILDGRVKTLHPVVHAGLLAVLDNPDHLHQLATHGIESIDLVVVNLYPFEATVAKPGVTLEEAIENIDIGGPTMLRSAAKNYKFTAAIIDPSRYEPFLAELRENNGSVSEATSFALAREVFRSTAKYDAAITAHLDGRDEAGTLPATFSLSLPKAMDLRYGENPHQAAALYGDFLNYFRKLHGKELSFNNIIDANAAVNLLGEFDMPTVVIVKHTNPCGAASAASLVDAYKLAFATDTKAPYGGIIAVNRPLDMAAADAMNAIFTEIIIAPSFEPGVLEFLMKKKDRRLIELKPRADGAAPLDVRSVAHGMLVQTADTKKTGAADVRVVTRRAPTEDEMTALLFGWKIVKHVKSNAIVYAGVNRTLGIGAGQMSRVESSKIAVLKAAEEHVPLAGSIIASDAYFPFADGLLEAVKAGATAVIQPGGSVRDEEVIAAANEHNIAMVFTGVRHFRH